MQPPARLEAPVRRAAGVASLGSPLRIAGKRRLARKQIEQGAAQTVDVGAAVGGVGVDNLLGGNVIHCANDIAGERQAARLVRLAVETRQPKIENLDLVSRELCVVGG